MCIRDRISPILPFSIGIAGRPYNSVSTTVLHCDLPYYRRNDSLENSNKVSPAPNGRNRTGPPCSVGSSTTHSPAAGRQRYRRQTTTTDVSVQNNTGPLGGSVTISSSQSRDRMKRPACAVSGRVPPSEWGLHYAGRSTTVALEPLSSAPEVCITRLAVSNDPWNVLTDTSFAASQPNSPSALTPDKLITPGT